MAKSGKSWKEVITQVLYGSDSAMHYTDIAEKVAELQLKTDLGANPAASVVAVISQDINSNGNESIFVRAQQRGYYMLNMQSPQLGKLAQKKVKTVAEPAKSGPDTVVPAVIGSFGMYWRRDFVAWKQRPKLLGQQQLKSAHVDFADQIGIYLLHSETGVVYVGRTTDQPMGTRLFQHTQDRLNGRWMRFSWFGLKAVADSGSLNPPDLANLDSGAVISGMEAVLIEGLEPPQNRRAGDGLTGIEYIQIKDPEIDRKEKQKTMEEIIRSYNAQH